MAQFNVYHNPSPTQRSVYPYMVDIQNDLFASFNTRLTMPLQRLSLQPAQMPRRLSTAIVIDGESLYLAPHLCAAFPVKVMGKALLHLDNQSSIVKDALDAIVEGV